MNVLRVVVTGASSGIGEATVRAFRAAGWEVVGVARREDRLRALAEETGASVFVADLTDQGDVDALRDHLEATGPVHALVNNAGGAKGLDVGRGVVGRGLGVDVRGQRAGAQARHERTAAAAAARGDRARSRPTS